ncbi:MAG: hypothetical protein ACXWNW_13510, partial [Isosphaeraceae bacterium]
SFCDHHFDPSQRDRLYLDRVRVVVNQWFGNLSGPLNRRDQMLFHQIEPHFHVRAKPLWVFAPAQVIRPGRKDEVIILAQHDGPDSLLPEFVCDGFAGFGFAAARLPATVIVYLDPLELMASRRCETISRAARLCHS